MEAQGCRATVRRLRNHRIQQVQLEHLLAADEPQAADATAGGEAPE